MRGYFTGMSSEVVARINQRLRAVKLTESAACLKAGLSDSAVRNVRKALKSGKDAKFSARTLEALAPVLETTASWLLEGSGDELAPADVREMNSIFPGLASDDQKTVLALAKRLRRPAPPDDGTTQGEGDGPPPSDG